MASKVIPGIAPETMRVFEFLLNRQAGHKVTWSELCELTGKDLEKTRAHLASALSRLRNQHRQEWGTLRGIGIQRLADGEIVVKSDGQTRKMRRGLGRTLKILECADYENLTPDEKQRHDALMIGSRTARMFLGQDGQEKLRKNLTVQNGFLPNPKGVLEMFK